MGRIAVVDVGNRFVRWEDRVTIHRDHLYHRSVHVLVFGSDGRLVVQRRHESKQTYPRHWDTAVAGHVEEEDYVGGPDDELERVYEAVARREVREELGVEVDVKLLGAFAPDPAVHYEHIRLYRAVADGPFVIQADEVEEIRHVTRAELEAMNAAGEPMTLALLYFTRWLGDW